MELTIKKDREIADEKLTSAISNMSQDFYALIKKDREAIDQKLYHQEKLSEELLSAMNQLSLNFTTIQIQLKKDRGFFKDDSDINKNVNMLDRVEEFISHMSTAIGQNLSLIQAQTNVTELTADERHVQLQEMIINLASRNDLAWYVYYQTITFPVCKEIRIQRSSRYLIQPIGYDKPFEGYCDQTTFGGGWLVFQHRFDGSMDFNREWANFRDGFGSVDGEYWLGLKHLHRLTSVKPHELLVEMKCFDGIYKYARYSEFEIGSEEEKYVLKKLEWDTGTAGDSFTGKGNKFTTKDRQNDLYHKNCAQKHYGAWWHNACTYSNLNGRYQNGTNLQNMYWYKFNNDGNGLAYSRMSIREI